MELKDKIEGALTRAFGGHTRLEHDDAISGFIVSSAFEGMSALDRQTKIAAALRQADPPLQKDELRQILMIAALTPAESDSAGVRIRVHRVCEPSPGSLEILIHGGMADARYVSRALASQGIRVAEPKDVPGASGVFMELRAKGPEDGPLTKATALSLLAADPYIEVMPNA